MKREGKREGGPEKVQVLHLNDLPTRRDLSPQVVCQEQPWISAKARRQGQWWSAEVKTSLLPGSPEPAASLAPGLEELSQRATAYTAKRWSKVTCGHQNSTRRGKKGAHPLWTNLSLCLSFKEQLKIIQYRTPLAITLCDVREMGLHILTPSPNW